MEVPNQVAVILFFNKNGDILLQDRRKRSKWGEEYGFFGGMVEAGESPEQTIRRELIEELELKNVKLELFRRYKYRNPTTGTDVDRSVYLSEMPDLTGIVCHEGEIALRRFENSLDLKMIPGFNELLKEIYEFLKSQHRTR